MQRGYLDDLVAVVRSASTAVRERARRNCRSIELGSLGPPTFERHFFWKTSLATPTAVTALGQPA